MHSFCFGLANFEPSEEFSGPLQRVILGEPQKSKKRRAASCFSRIRRLQQLGSVDGQNSAVKKSMFQTFPNLRSVAVVTFDNMTNICGYVWDHLPSMDISGASKRLMP